MYTVTFDQSQNWLTIVYSGYVDPSETHRCAEEIRVAVAKTKPGFRLLVDMTDLQGMEVSCAPHIRSLMDTCNQNGIAEVVRIIPNPKLDIGLQIMSYFHYSGEVRIVTCESADEANSFPPT